MQASRRHDDRSAPRQDDPRPDWRAEGGEASALESSTRLASERPTVPPPRPSGLRPAGGFDVVVAHIHLGPSVDEILYRLSLGDLAGAELASEELAPCVPVRRAAPVVIASMDLGYVDEFMLASIDGEVTWGDLLDGSPFGRRETLRAMCDLVDKRAVGLTR